MLFDDLALCYVRTMVTIQQAAQAAADFARATLGPERTAGLQLEEVESAHANDEDAWLITFSMIAAPQNSLTALNAVIAPRREYKIFTVLKKNGEVTSMRIRELAVS